MPRVVLLGMESRLATGVLAGLAQSDLAVAAVVLPALAGLPLPEIAALPPARIPGRPLLLPQQTTSLRAIAHTLGAPVHEVAREGLPGLAGMLAAYAPEALVVACFPWRLPHALLDLAPLGCLNVHPSLLPRHRGPDPLFWTFHNGDEEAGVTIHLMDSGLDTGPILLHTPRAVPAGTTEAELEAACAQFAAQLLPRAVAGLRQGTLAATPQDASRATYDPAPHDEDYILDPALPAERHYRFICGVAARGVPLRLALPGLRCRVRAALAYDAHGTLPTRWRLEGDVLHLRCTPGTLTARVAV